MERTASSGQDNEVMTPLASYVPRFTYTDEPLPVFEAFDGSVPLDVYRMRLDRADRIERARRNPMLKARNSEGKSLYVLTDSGTVRRAFPLTPKIRNAVIDRDQACVWCKAHGRLEVDHVVRYIDGGGNGLENLRALCHDCHATRGAE